MTISAISISDWKAENLEISISAGIEQDVLYVCKFSIAIVRQVIVILMRTDRRCSHAKFQVKQSIGVLAIFGLFSKNYLDDFTRHRTIGMIEERNKRRKTNSCWQKVRRKP